MSSLWNGVARKKSENAKAVLQMEKPVVEEIPGSTVAVNLYNQLEILRQQRDQLEQRQGIIIKDPDLANAILAIAKEIKRLQSGLERARRRGEKK